MRPKRRKINIARKTVSDTKNTYALDTDVFDREPVFGSYRVHRARALTYLPKTSRRIRDQLGVAKRGIFAGIFSKYLGEISRSVRARKLN